MRNMEKTKKIKIKPYKWRGWIWVSSETKLVHGAVLRVLIGEEMRFSCCSAVGLGEGKCKVMNEVVNSCWSEVLGSWESKHKGAIGSLVGPLHLHWCNVTLLWDPKLDENYAYCHWVNIAHENLKKLKTSSGCFRNWLLISHKTQFC